MSHPAPQATTDQELRRRRAILSASKFIHVRWVDLTNNVRERVIPLSSFEKLLRTEQPSIAIAAAAHGMVHLILSEGFSPIGELLYVFDMNSLRLNSYLPGHASVMGFFKEKFPSPLKPTAPYDVEYCSRTLLKRIEDEAKAIGIEFLVGFETEFVLLEKGSKMVPVNRLDYSVTEALFAGNREAAALEEIATALEDAGIEVLAYHKEAAPGQYEVITGPLSPLKAADALVDTREVIRNVANKHGMKATLAPRVFDDSCGSASHAHVSIRYTDGRSEDSSTPNLTKLEAAFLAGALEHLPSILALTLPTYASYARVADGSWSGGTYVAWGADNREAPIRLANETSSNSRNFEFKTVDGTSNPYLALSGIIAIGMEGVRNEYYLRAKNINGKKTAAELSEEERREAGIVKRLPLTLEQAREMFSRNGPVRKAFGEEFVEKYMSVNKTLEGAHNSCDDNFKRKERLIAMY